MPIKYNRYFPHSIARRSSPPGVAHVAAVCRVPYRSVHESKRASRRRSDTAVMQRGALKATAKASTFPMRARRTWLQFAGKEAPGTTGRHPNGPSPKQPSPCRPHIMALRTAMSAPPAATETKISRVAGRMTAHVSPDPPIRPTYRAARAMPTVRGACQAAMRAARPNHSART